MTDRFLRLPPNLRRRVAVEKARRCWCGRPIAPDSISTCGCCCTEHDALPVPVGFGNRYGPSPEPIDRTVS